MTCLEDAAAAIIAEAEALTNKLRLQRIDDLDLTHKQYVKEFDDALLIASTMFGVPYAEINVVTDKVQITKAAIGSKVETVRSLDQSICKHVIAHPDKPFVVKDAHSDPNILHPEIKFYAGAPLVTNDGLALGAICVYDKDCTKELTEKQRDCLMALSRIVAKLLK